jgi:hypothetical protein
MENIMSENEHKRYEQSPVWKKLNELEVGLSEANGKIDALPMALSLLLEQRFPTHKDVKIAMSGQTDICNAKFLTKEEIITLWDECYEANNIKQFKKSSRLVAMAKWVGLGINSLVLMFLFAQYLMK